MKELKTVVETVKEDCQAQTEVQVRGWVLLTESTLPVVVQHTDFKMANAEAPVSWCSNFVAYWKFLEKR